MFYFDSLAFECSWSIAACGSVAEKHADVSSSPFIYDSYISTIDILSCRGMEDILSCIARP
jgi:hypothetical protein